MEERDTNGDGHIKFWISFPALQRTCRMIQRYFVIVLEATYIHTRRVQEGDRGRDQSQLIPDLDIDQPCEQPPPSPSARRICFTELSLQLLEPV